MATQAIALSDWIKERPGTRALLPLGARMLELGVGALAMVALLSEFGYPVASLVAGLGIGGVALALGAQKTFENLFGAFAIGADQPLREGDLVRIEDFVGTVEAIGLRSTRIRTLDRTIITLPNSKLADSRIETFAVRDRLRRIARRPEGAPQDLVGGDLGALQGVRRLEPQRRSHGLVTTSNWPEFRQIREDVLIQFMEFVEREGSSFAFLTRSLHI